MNKFLRRLPLQAKLLLIGLIPIGFLVIATWQIYLNSSDKLSVIRQYRAYILQSQNLGGLITSLQRERKFSFDFAMTGNMARELSLQRPITDDYVAKLKASGDLSIAGFEDYTRIGELASIRAKVDRNQASPNDVMHFYSNTVFRMNTLNSVPRASVDYLKPLYQDLQAQRILSEMTTYLGIISANIYNVLHTRKYMIETLVGTAGPFEIFESYETEFLVKAGVPDRSAFLKLKKSSALGPTMDYMAHLFQTYEFDGQFSAVSWWTVSRDGTDALHGLQQNIWTRIDDRLAQMEIDAGASQRSGILFLVLALAVAMIAIAYIAYIISQTLERLKDAAERISHGETDVGITIESSDVIGTLALAISTVDRTNQSIAEAASQIGAGNFSAPFEPRGEKDLLGEAILGMREKLQQYHLKMESIVAERTRELERSNEDLQRFAHVASHDMKEPLRKISTFSSILLLEQENLTARGRTHLEKIEIASHRLSTMIEGVLAYSTMGGDKALFVPVDLNQLIADVESDLELSIMQHKAVVTYEKLPEVMGIPLLLHQLFYNLLTNAIKFRNPDSSPLITITCTKARHAIEGQKERDYFHIIIQDNGIGFDQSHAEKIFAIFSRLNSKDQYEGTGLGLALCRKIVERHGGAIYARADEGIGSAFHILFPA